MPIGLVSDSQFENELKELSGNKKESHTKATENSIVEVLDRPGRKDGDVNVPDSLRAIIGETSVIEGRKSAVSLASQFGISPSSVSAYAKGATSTASYDSPSKSIISHINKSRQRAIKKASRTLNGALSAISQEKLDNADVKDLSGIAKDMSVIIKNLEPEKVVDSEAKSTTPQFVIFAPQFRDERTFETIHVVE